MTAARHSSGHSTNSLKVLKVTQTLTSNWPTPSEQITHCHIVIWPTNQFLREGRCAPFTPALSSTATTTTLITLTSVRHTKSAITTDSEAPTVTSWTALARVTRLRNKVSFNWQWKGWVAGKACHLSTTSSYCCHLHMLYSSLETRYNS